ncbi:MAG: hypothetical protein ACRYG5_01365 [Janthinobacterium lividum]
MKKAIVRAVLILAPAIALAGCVVVPARPYYGGYYYAPYGAYYR